MKPPSLSIIIVNYNGRDFLPELFSSLDSQQWRDFEVLFVDNASTDGSSQWVGSNYPAARVIQNSANTGFSKANNRGARESRGEFLATLNTDMRLDPAWTMEIVAPLQQRTSVAAVSSKIFLVSHPGILNGVGGAMNFLGYTWDRGMFEPDQGQYDCSEEVLFASAGAAAFRRSTFLEAGGFDEAYFMYHEDVDLCWRLRLLGHSIVTAPRAVAYHHFAGTSQRTFGLSRREHIGERHNIRTLIKHYEWKNLRRALWRLLLLPQSPARKWILLKNFGWNLRHLPATLVQRRRIQKLRLHSDREISRLILASDHVPIRLQAGLEALAAKQP
ncbi:MAG: glycosyltransferase family 2 protein [Acidobacteriota bacterium]